MLGICKLPEIVNINKQINEIRSRICKLEWEEDTLKVEYEEMKKQIDLLKKERARTYNRIYMREKQRIEKPPVFPRGPYVLKDRTIKINE